jgi:hypothetical protein
VPENSAHILQGMVKSHGLQPFVRNHRRWTVQFIIQCTLEVFIVKLLGGAEEIKQIYTFKSKKREIHLSRI